MESGWSGMETAKQRRNNLHRLRDGAEPKDKLVGMAGAVRQSSDEEASYGQWGRGAVRCQDFRSWSRTVHLLGGVGYRNKGTRLTRTNEGSQYSGGNCVSCIASVKHEPVILHLSSANPANSFLSLPQEKYWSLVSNLKMAMSRRGLRLRRACVTEFGG